MGGGRGARGVRSAEVAGGDCGSGAVMASQGPAGMGSAPVRGKARRKNAAGCIADDCAGVSLWTCEWGGGYG